MKGKIENINVDFAEKKEKNIVEKIC